MKATQDKQFNPITIVLESEVEAKVLHALTGGVCGDLTSSHKVTERLFLSLHELKIESLFEDYFTGRIKSER